MSGFVSRSARTRYGNHLKRARLRAPGVTGWGMAAMTLGASGGRDEIGKPHAKSSSKASLMNSDERELFQRIRTRLRAMVGEDVFNSWFARLELEEIVDDRAHLSVPTRFLCSWIQSNYADKLLETFKSEMPDVARLHFTVRINGQARPRLNPAIEMPVEAEAVIAPQAARPIRDIAAPRGDALSGSALDPRHTFDNFVTGPSNEIALGIAKQIASAALNGTVSFNPVYIHSTVGRPSSGYR